MLNTIPEEIKKENGQRKEVIDQKDFSLQIPEMIFQYRLERKGMGRFQYVSSSAQEIFGYSPQLILGNDLLAWNTVHPDDMESLRRVLRRSATEMTDLRWEGRVIDRENFALKWISVVGRPERADDDAVVWNGVMHDVSRLKQTHIEMKHATEVAEKKAQMKEDALAILSHELRTPLNGILGVAQLMEIDARADQMEYINLLKGSAENLMAMITNVLDLSKLNAGKMRVANQEIHLQQFLHFLRSIHASRASQGDNNLIFTVGKDLPRGFKSDEMMLNQILNNLLSNALKFTSNGRVELVINLVSDFSKKLLIRFSVKDTGSGIPEEDLKTIFEKYAQSSNNHNHIGGTGLGLNLCQRFLSLLGSELRVNSEPDKGSEFYFDILVDKV